MTRFARRSLALVPLLAALSVGGLVSSAQARPAEDVPPGVSVSGGCDMDEAGIRVYGDSTVWGATVMVSVDGGTPVQFLPVMGNFVLWFYDVGSGYHDVSWTVNGGELHQVNDLEVLCAQNPVITYSCRDGQAYVQVALDATKPEWTYYVLLSSLPDFDEEYSQSDRTGTLELGPFPDGSSHALETSWYSSGNYAGLQISIEFTFDCASYAVSVPATGSNTGPMLALAGLSVGVGLVLTLPRRLRRS